MVTFGGSALPHVLDVQISKTRLTTERDLPYGSVAYRSDDRDLGQTLVIMGEIRETDIEEVILKIEGIRALNDGTSRTLDLEDGTATITSKLTDPAFHYLAGEWFIGRYHVPYYVTLLEVAYNG